MPLLSSAAPRPYIRPSFTYRAEGRGVPLLERPLRLNVVVRVEQDGGCAVRAGDRRRKPRDGPRRARGGGHRSHPLGSGCPSSSRRRCARWRGRSPGSPSRGSAPDARAHRSSAACRRRSRRGVVRSSGIGGASLSAYGESRRIVQPSPLRSYRKRSWRRCSRPCQNSTVIGATRYPPQNGGRGTSTPW